MCMWSLRSYWMYTSYVSVIFQLRRFDKLKDKTCDNWSLTDISQLAECLLALTHRSQFQAPSLPAHMYVDENGPVAILAAKRTTGVTQDMSLREHVRHLPSAE